MGLVVGPLTGPRLCHLRLRPDADTGGVAACALACVVNTTRVMSVNTGDVRGASRLAALLLRDVEQIAERSAARMQELLPSYAKVPRHELTPIVQANTRNLLEAIRDTHEDSSRARVGYRASGESRARQGIASDDMLQAWRIGLDNVREEAHAVADEHEIGEDVLLEFVEATLRWGDIGMRVSASSHHDAEIRELARLVDQQAALRRVATQVAGGAPSASLYALVAEQVAGVLRVPLVSIARYEADGTATECASRSERGELFPMGTRWSLEGTNVLAEVRERAGPARINDYTGLKGVIAETWRDRGIRSTVGVPIVVAGEPWGAIVASSPEVEPLPADTESRLMDFSELVAMAISNANARAEVERLAEEQAALRRVATMVARGCSPGEAFVKVAEEVALVLGVDSAAIQRFEPDGYATVVGNWGKLGDAFQIGSRLKLDGDSVIALVYRTERPVRIDNYERASGSAVERAREVGLRSGAGSPILVNGRLWGAMGIATSRAEPLPVGVEWRIAEFTELLATAISNVQARSDLAASRARVVAASDKTRRQIERDLHDGAQQRLVHTVITLKLARRALRTDDEAAPALVDEALGHAQQANVELRELVQGILPPLLRRSGLQAAIEALAARMPVPVEIRVSVGRLPGPVEATAYFVVAEALTNVAKHSGARHASVVARVEDSTLELQVCDDGVGGARRDGSGFVGLADRLAVFDGHLQVESPADGGTLIAATIPVR
jgi:signal transduction histidine kinase